MDTTGGFVTIDDLIAQWCMDPEFAAAMEQARGRRRGPDTGAEEVTGMGDG